jgi:hypothetical protein
MKKSVVIASATLVLVVGSMLLYNFSIVRAQSPPASIDWSNSVLQSDQNGSIELGTPTQIGTNPTAGAEPYIDFHYGNGFSQDYNARLLNFGDGRLLVEVQRPNNGGPVIPLDITSANTIVNDGIGQGTGIKHARGAGCSGGAGTCSATVNWSGTAFPNAAYTVSCTPENADLGNALTIIGKTGSSVTVKLSVPQQIGVSMTGVDCIAMHD